MKTHIILNPWADRGRAAGLEGEIKAWGARSGEVVVMRTKYPGHAKELAEGLANAGISPIVAAGGDGTIHEVINGIMNAERNESSLAVIPIGSGNDFAWGMGLDNNLEMALGRINAGKTRHIDLAHISDNRGKSVYVDNTIGIGFDATINIESRQITRIHGFAMYTLATLRTIAFYYATPHLHIQFDGESVSQKTLLLAVGVGAREGGGFLMLPNAKNDDGLLDSCLIDPMPRWRMLSLLPSLMKGTHGKSHLVTMRRHKTITLTSDMPLPIHTDGELYAHPDDNVRQLTITTLPNALSIII
jgi:YegS/Rv2252/BmrU family lipid kinase